MVGSLLLLELSGSPHALIRLGRQLGELIEGPREVAVYLGDRTPEEVLAVCAAHGVRVGRSRVIAGLGESQSPSRDGRADRHSHQRSPGAA